MSKRILIDREVVEQALEALKSSQILVDGAEAIVVASGASDARIRNKRAEALRHRESITDLRTALYESAVDSMADGAQKQGLGYGAPSGGMTACRAVYFMERFKREEKLLGPNEQAALDFVIAVLERQEPEFETRADGERVRVDRWQVGIRRIVALLWGNRREFEVDEVVEAVRGLISAPKDDDESLVRAVLGQRQEPEPYDQTELDLCDKCGWKAVKPGEGCLNCQRQEPEQSEELLIDGAAYTVPPEVAAELLRLQIELKQRQQSEKPKCDGNHGGPRCADPECWNDDPQRQEPEQEPVTQLPAWVSYDSAADVLTIHGRRYSGAMFGEAGFLSPVGTLLQVAEGQPDCVTLITVTPVELTLEARWERDEAMLRQALEALETEADHPGVIDEQAVNAAITALRERLKEAT
jgi:hypothetical protein